MEALVVGDVVVADYRYSDNSGNKRRPALVLAPAVDDDIIICQITTRIYPDAFAVPLQDKDFKNGALKEESFIRPNKIGTYDMKLIHYRIGQLNATKMKEVSAMLKKVLPLQ